MNRRTALLAGGMALTGSALAAVNASAAPQQHKHGNHNSDLFARCADACLDCTASCASCFEHCTSKVVSGSKDHAATLRLCNDCSDICTTAGKLVARQGPLSIDICKACVEACDKCATACEKFPDESHVADCAKHCRACAKACREMIKHLST